MHKRVDLVEPYKVPFYVVGDLCQHCRCDLDSIILYNRGYLCLQNFFLVFVLIYFFHKQYISEPVLDLCEEYFFKFGYFGFYYIVKMIVTFSIEKDDHESIRFIDPVAFDLLVAFKATKMGYLSVYLMVVFLYFLFFLFEKITDLIQYRILLFQTTFRYTAYACNCAFCPFTFDNNLLSLTGNIFICHSQW